MNFAIATESLFLACPMCMSGASGKALMAANSAIGLMLVILFAVLASIFSFILYLARRARQYSSELQEDSGSNPIVAAGTDGGLES